MARNAWLLFLLLLASPSAFGANLTAVSVSPTSVVGGMSGATGTVTLDVVAPAGGAVIALSSNNAAASVPLSVTVAAGATTATFAVTTTTVTTNAAVTLTGTYNAVNKTATLTVTTLVSAVTLSQSSVVGGMAATGTVTLYAPAPAGGAVVTLTSSAPTRATVPASITIPAGASLATFAIPTLLATTTGATTITATNAGGSRTVALTTSAVPIPDSLTLAPSTAFGSSTSTATVTLNGAAPAGGTVVTLTSSNTAAATVPANVTVPAGSVSTTFTVITLMVASNTNVTITAASGGTSKTATQTVAPTLQAFSTTLDRTSVTRGQTPTATVTLNGPAPTGGATVTLTSSSITNATVPASVGVVAGARTATFPVTTLTSGTGASVTISAAYGGVTKTVVLSLTASPVVRSVAFSAPVVTGGQTSTGTLTLSGPAPVGGAVVTLSSSATAVVTVPASVTVLAAASTATFTATTVAVGNDVGTVISATVGTSSANATLTATAPRPTGLLLAPATVVGGNPSTGTVTISAAAPTGGVPVFLSSSSIPTATVPTSVTVPAGATSVAFTVTTLGVAAATPVTISAVKQQTAVTANLTVNPADIASVTLSPTSVVAGATSTGTVTLNGNARTGGISVALTSSDTTKATVPASVTVAAGATTATFAVTTTTVTTNATVTLTGTYNAVNKTATLTVTTLVSAVTLSQSSVVGGMAATGTVTLYAPAPAGGTVVTLTSSAPTRATVPASITIPAGASLATFAIPTLLATTTGSTTITATNAGGSRTVALTTSAVPIPDSLTLAPSTAFGSSTSTATVTLNGAAPAGGTVVTLTSSNTAAATVPANVTVPAGSVSTNFTVTTLTVVANTNVTITAASGGTSKTATQTVAPTLQAFSTTLDRTSVTRGQTPTATVTLNGPAPTGGATVTLTSSSTANATVPASVVVAVGARSATFPVTTLTSGTGASVTISAAYGGATKTVVLSLTASPVVRSVAFSAPVVTGGQTSTGTVTLSGPAPTGGTVVTLSSSATGVVTVPATVTVLAAASTATFTATTVAVGNDVGTVISATVGTSSANATLTATAPRPTGLLLAPATIVGGNPSTGTVTISAAAPAGGVSVFLLSSSIPTATVPTSVTVPAGATSVAFTVTTFGVAAPTPVTISAVKQQTAVTATLTVNPADIASVTLSPTSVVAGATSTGTVTLNGNARTGGISVALTSSDTTKATVPASVTVAAGATSATFTVTTLGVATSSPVTISGSYNATTKSGALTVQKASLSSVSLSASSVVGGNNVTGTVTLNGKAGAAGFAVALSSSDTTCATVPATVTVATNATTATFTVTTLGVAANKSSTITATLSGVPKTVLVSTTPAALSTVTLSPTAVQGGTSSTGTLTLNGNAPPAGAVVSMSSSDGSATVPATVTVAANTKTKTFTVTTTAVAVVKTSTISGTYLGTTQSAPLMVNPPALSAVAVSPTSVNGGTAVTGTVTISSIAPTGGFAVALTSNNAAATVPATVTVAAGASTATFSVPTSFVGVITTATLTASAAAVTKTAVLTINPVTLALASVTLSPVSLTGGASSTGTVTLAAPAQTGGFTVNLSSDKTAATLPASVTVASGALTATFTVTTVAVGTVTTATITATAAAVTKTATLTINPPVLSTVSLSPATVVGGTSSSGSVTLTSAAPVGSFAIVLTSNKPAAVVPASISVAAGATTGAFTVTTTATATNVAATISGTANGTTKSAVLNVNAPALSSLSVSPASVAGGTGSTGTVSLTGPAAAGGVVVSLSSNDASAVVPASVALAAGATTATFGITTTNVASTRSVTVSATLSAVTKTATLSVTPCIVPPAAAPSSFPAGDVVWIEDATPAGAYLEGAWIWDTTQKASGTKSHTGPASSGDHYNLFYTDTDLLYIADTDKLVVYVLLNPCDPPRELMFMWYDAVAGWEHRAFWGEDLIPSGVLGTPSRTYMGPLPAAGQWVRLEVPAATVALDGHTLRGMIFDVYDGQVWFDRAGKIATCTPSVAAAPSLPADTVWVEDTLPAGSITEGTWTWDTTQKASGTKSHTEPARSGEHGHSFYTDTDLLYVADTDKLVVYVLLNPCDPPRELMFMWYDAVAGWEHRAFWGEDLIPSGVLGTPSRTYMGPLPAAGQWVRLEAPAATVALDGHTLRGMIFDVYDGQVWFDRAGKIATCTPSVAAAPSLPADTVWVEDTLPAGSGTEGTWTWDTTQKASGTKSHTEPARTGEHWHTFYTDTDLLYIADTDKLVVYALLNPCDPPRELMVMWYDAVAGWDHRAFWGEDLIPSGVLGTPSRTYMGPLPIAGQWVRLDVPAATLGLDGHTARGMLFDVFDGQVWFDRAGKIATCTPPVAAAPSLPADTVWVEDTLPAGSGTEGTWTWDTTQKASGTKSHTEPARTGEHWHSFYTDTQLQPVNVGDKLVVYALLNPCDPPRELMFMWYDAVAGWEHRAFWGEDLIPSGVLGMPSRTYMGPLPAAGQWARLEVPAAALALEGHTLRGMIFDAYDGQAWFDRAGTSNSVISSALASVSVSPTSVLGGTSATGTVTLSAPALAGGFTVTLSSDKTAASVPASVTVAQGATTASFTVTTTAVGAVTTATITATAGAITKTATLTINPPALSNVSLSPTSVIGGTPSTGTATLSSAAPAGGFVVNLTSNNAAATVPTSVTVASGATTATFTVTTTAIGTVTTATITASAAGVTKTAALTIGPPVLALVSVALSPTSLTGGASSTGTVTLGAPALAGGFAVNLSSDKTAATVPATLTVLQGATTATFTVSTAAVGTVTTATITATAGAVTTTATLTINPPALSNVSLSPTTVTGGTSSTGTVTLSSAAPASGFIVNLTSNNAAASVPANVTVAQGITTATFTVTTTAVGTVTTATITATAAGVTKTATLIINPPALSNVSLSPTTVTGGTSSTGTVTLSSAAPAGGFVVNLSSNNAAANVPANVTVAQGATTATFMVTTTAVGTVTTATITATAAAVTKTAPLTINPVAPTLAFAAVSPASLTGGASSTGTVTLGAPALAGGFAVNLSSDKTAATVPAIVTVLQGATTATFTVTTVPVGIVTAATITATAATVTKTAPLTINPPVLSSVSLNPTSVTGGTPSTGTVTLASAAPAGGFSVSLSSDNGAATVPANVTMTQGATVATFTVTTAAVVSMQTATITAAAGGVVRTVSLIISRPLPTGELTEGNASDWTPFASDSATTSLTNDTSHARSGTYSVKLVTASGGDTGIRYPAVGQVHWNISSRAFLTFWAYIESNGTFAGNQPTVVLLGPAGSIRYTPSSPLTHPNQWHHYEIALAGDSGWTRNVTGTMDLTNVVGFEIHHQSSPAGFTAYYDDLSLVSTLPGDLAEGNAQGWGSFSTDVYGVLHWNPSDTFLTNDLTRIVAGGSSLRFHTSSGFDTGATYPAAGNAHWDLSTFDSLTFWIYAINLNPSFQGPQPVLVLRCPNGSYTYTPSGTLMSTDAWRLYQIPLSGGGPWSRSSTGSPTLSDVNQIELHFDTWGFGFELYIDGLTFGDTPNMGPAPNLSTLSLNPPSVTGGTASTATVTLSSAARAAGVLVAFSSDNASAVVPTSVLIPANALSAQFTVATSSVGAPTTASISGLYLGTTKTANLAINPSAISTLFGVVLSLPSGAVLPGATVTVNQTGATTTTNVAGAFAFALPAGSYTVTASAGGYQSATSPLLTVTAGQRTTAAPLYLSQPTGTFAGFVVTGGNPVAGAVVTATLTPFYWRDVSYRGGIPTTTTTLADGTFQLAAQPYMSNALVISKPGFADNRLFSLTVYPGQTTNVGTVSLVSGGTITGVVRNSMTSAPVAGATVQWLLYGGGSPSTVTDETGRFAFSVAPGTSQLSVTATGFDSTSTPSTYVVSAGQTTTTPDIPIVPTHGFITGHVVLSVGGGPVPGASISVAPDDHTYYYGLIATDANGFFSRPTLAGTRTVSIRKDGYAGVTSAPVIVTMGATVDLGDVSLDQDGVVTGTVINASTGVGIGSATITATGTSAWVWSAADGSFAIMVPPGAQTLTVAKVGFSPLTTAPISVSAGDSLSAGALALTPGGTITGTVKDALTQAGLYGVNVTITGTTNTVTTWSYSGEFTLMQVPGLWTLTFSKNGYVSTATPPLGVTAGGSSDLGTIYLVPQATVTGTVLDDRGYPVRSAGALVKGSNASAYTDASGFFGLLATAGTSTLVIKDPPCVYDCLDYESAPFTLVPGETRNLGSITLARAEQITGPLYPLSGSAPLEGGFVTATSSSRTISGPLPLKVPPDTYNLVLSLDGWLSRTCSFPLSYQCDFHLTRSGSLVGTVVNAAGGAPVPGATVTAGTVSAVTDAFGNFVLSVAAGSYPIAITKANWSPTTTAARTVVTGDETNAGIINLTAQAIVPGTITGTVANATGGAPVAGALVSVIGGSASATTNVSGVFSLVESPGSYPLLITRSGWAALTTAAVTVTSGVTTPAPGISLSATAGTVTGIVVDVASSAGISGAVVTVVGTALTATTNATGAFTISLAPGSYVLSASKAGWYSPVTAGVTVTSAGSTGAGSLWMSRDATLVGRVVNSFGGAPVFGVTLADFSGYGTPAVTDANGAFRLSAHSTNALGIPATSTGLSLKRLNWPTLNTASGYPLAPGVTTDVGTLAMTGTGLIVGRIVPQYINESFTVTVTGTGSSTQTPINVQQFQLRQAPGDNLTLTIHQDRFLDLVTPPFSVRSGQVTDAGNLSPTPFSLVAFSGHVLDSVSGTHIVGATVTMNPQGLSTTTGSDGGYTLTGVIPGLVTFIVSKSGYATQSFPRQIDGWTSQVDLYLAPPNAPALRTFTVSPAAIIGGTDAGVRFDFSLTKMPPPIGATIQITSSNPGVVEFFFEGVFVAPGLMAVYLNTAAWTFNGHPCVTFGAVSVETPVTLIASYGGVTLTAIVLVEPLPPAPVWSISLVPDSVTGGSPSTGTVSLLGPAPAGGASVLLYSFDGAVAVPVSVTVPQGATSATFPITTTPVTTARSAEIWAVRGYTREAYLTVNPAPPSASLTGISLVPPSVTSGSPSTGTVTLNGPAATGGALVALSSNDAAASVPASVTVPQGASSATFAVTTSAVTTTRSATITAVYGATRTASLTVNPAPPATLIGVAPGWVLPGDTTPVLYGANILAGSTVSFTGPVYSLSDFAHAICTLGVNCPSSALAATVDVGGAYAAFAIPSGAAPGLYHLKVRSAAGIDSANNQWIAVDSAQQTRAVVPPGLHQYATRIYTGQRVTGTLTGDNPSGEVADFNFYTFVATAGSRISLAMNRVDTSLPWENPASLDPQIEVIAPDGFIYGNLEGIDNQPGIDLNASITNAILPQTGVYFVRAGTTRGSGQYQLSFGITAMAPAPVGNRVIPVSGNHNTLPLNTPANVQSFMLDSRGWPVAGATYTFTGQNGSGDTGTAAFLSGATGPTSLTGEAAASFKMTSQGKARFKPSLDSPLLSQFVYFPYGEAAASLAEAYDEGSGELRIPVFSPVGRSSVRILSVSGNDAQLSGGKLEKLPSEQLRARFDLRGDLPGKGRTPQASGATSPAASDPSGAAPLRTSATALSVVRQPLTISACSGELEVFTQAGVNASNLNLPFAVTLTDLTPSTGQVTPNGLVDTVTGLHGHRIENPDGTSKKIRLKLDVKDSAGNAPTHPVLVSLSVGGPQHGTLIVDPDGNKVECTRAFFLWHERDAQGNVIAPNEEFEYRLGTLASYVGETPDPAHPGQVLPVWGTTESLDVTISTVDGTGSSSPLTTFTREYPVHPEPGRPHHFLSPYELNGQADSHVYDFWADYLTWAAGGLTHGSRGFGNSYYLVDRWANVTFGYGNTVSPAPTPQNITVTFVNQLAISSQPGYQAAFPGYQMDVAWSNAGGSMPSGNYSVPLSLNFSDDDYGTGTIVKNITLSFISGTLRALISQQNYDQRFGVDDSGWPVSVPPGATGGAIPATSKGDKKRLCFQIVSGTNVPYSGEIFETPHNVWGTLPQSTVYVVDHTESRDPHLEVTDLGRFKISVVDPYAMPVTDIAFQVHPCPRYDHEGPPNQGQSGGQAGRPCTDTVVASIGGVIPIYKVNNGTGADNRGYMGIELLQAPRNPGNYYIQFESLDGNYRVRQLLGLTPDPTAAGEFKGAFALCVVTGGQFLDENFYPIDPYVVDQPTTAYYRYLSPTASSSSLTVTVDSKPEGETTITDTITIALNRLAQSNFYLTPPFTLVPPATGPAPSARANRTTMSAGNALLITAPVSDLFPTISGTALPNVRAIAGDIKIKTDWRDVSEGRTSATWVTLVSSRHIFLGDDLRFTAQVPVGWSQPQTYRWSLKVDGKPFEPDGVDLSQPTITLVQVPFQKAGLLEVVVEVVFSSATKTGRTFREIWLETAPTAIITWINGDRINLPALFPGTPFTDSCVVAGGVAAWEFGVRLTFNSPYFPRDANAALLKAGAIPAPPQDFPDETSLLTFIYDHPQAYKEAQAVQYRTRVRDGSVRTTPDALPDGQIVTRAAAVGSTDLAIACTPLPKWDAFGEADPHNKKIFSLQALGPVSGFYTLNKGRIGPEAQRAYETANQCSNCTPYIWTKSVFTTDTPYPRTDWINWRTSFPTSRLYTSANAEDGGRGYPIVLVFENDQVIDPNSFLQNPEGD